MEYNPKVPNHASRGGRQGRHVRNPRQGRGRHVRPDVISGGGGGSRKKGGLCFAGLPPVLRAIVTLAARLCR